MEETKNCPYCGEEILAIAKKCKHCGEWLNEESEPVGQPKVFVPCPICGENIEEGVDICPICHERIKPENNSSVNNKTVLANPNKKVVWGIIAALGIITVIFLCFKKCQNDKTATVPAEETSISSESLPSYADLPITEDDRKEKVSNWRVGCLVDEYDRNRTDFPYIETRLDGKMKTGEDAKDGDDIFIVIRISRYEGVKISCYPKYGGIDFGNHDINIVIETKDGVMKTLTYRPLTRTEFQLSQEEIPDFINFLEEGRGTFYINGSDPSTGYKFRTRFGIYDQTVGVRYALSFLNNN